MDKNKFKTGTEPDGFRGIKWGTDISELSGMYHCRTSSDSKYSDIEICERQNDEMRIGGAILKRIEYCFWQDKFYSVQIYLKEKEDVGFLKDAVFEKFGDRELENKYFEAGAYLRWEGNITTMYLRGGGYYTDRDSSDFCMTSVEINKWKTAYEEKQKEIEKNERKKLAQEGAEKGF